MITYVVSETFIGQWRLVVTSNGECIDECECRTMFDAIERAYNFNNYTNNKREDFNINVKYFNK